MDSRYLPSKALRPAPASAPVNDCIRGAISGDVRERAQRADDARHGRAADDGLPGLPGHAAVPRLLRQHGAPAAASSAAFAAVPVSQHRAAPSRRLIDRCALRYLPHAPACGLLVMHGQAKSGLKRPIAPLPTVAALLLHPRAAARPEAPAGRASACRASRRRPRTTRPARPPRARAGRQPPKQQPQRQLWQRRQRRQQSGAPQT